MSFLDMFRHPKELKDLSPRDVQRRAARKAVLIDVRTPREFENGHIVGVHAHPLGSEREIAARYPKDAEIILVCQSGHRSAAAAAALLRLGYTNLSHLKGGMAAWHRDGGPVERRG